MPERRGRRLGVEAEQVQLATELAVVAFLRLLDAPQVVVELRLGLPDGAVDALEHRPFLIAPPISARGAQQLERPELTGRLNMRPAAEVAEGPVAIEADHARLLITELRDDLDLVVLAGGGQLGESRLTWLLGALERQICGDLLAHLALDRLEVGGGQGAGQIEIVVEAVPDGRTNPQLCSREELHDGRGHKVGGRVPHGVEPVVRAGVQHLNRARSDLVAVHHHAGSSAALSGEG